MHIRDSIRAICRFIRQRWISTSKIWRFLLGLLVVGVPCADSLFNLIDRIRDREGNAANIPIEQNKIFIDGDFEINASNIFNIAETTNDTDTTLDFGSTNELHFAVRKMQESYRAGEYDDAVRFARIADSILPRCDNHDMSVVADHEAVKAILMEEAFFNKEYDKVGVLHRELQTLGDNRYVATRPPYIAMEMVAELLKSGKKMFFFSPRELGDFRLWDKGQLTEVFTCLAKWGYIQPIMIDIRAKNHDFFYYEDFFGFEAPLPYVLSSILTGQTIDGHEIYSNEVSAQWKGRKKFDELDIDKCVAEELRLDESEDYIRGMHLSLEFKEDDPTKVRMHYTLNNEVSVNTNFAIKVEHRRLWKPGLTVSNIKNQMFITKSHFRTITHIVYRVPPQIWFAMVVLLMMAFSIPTARSDMKTNPGKDKKS